jgi:hypothetical protein
LDYALDRRAAYWLATLRQTSIKALRTSADGSSAGCRMSSWTPLPA